MLLYIAKPALMKSALRHEFVLDAAPTVDDDVTKFVIIGSVEWHTWWCAYYNAA